MKSPAKQDDGAFSFIQELAEDLNRGNIDLPSFPDVVLRIRQALEDEETPTDKLVQLVGAEPILAARLLAISNSAAMRPIGDPITDLNMAVLRLGRAMVRNSAMSFAMTQLKKSAGLDAVTEQLEKLWRQCAHVAAICYVLCRKYTKLNADEAMFVGLMHGIGRMYVVVRAESFPHVFESDDDVHRIMDEWGPTIGSSIVQNWGFVEHISDAVRDHQDIERQHSAPADYTDVLIVARLMYKFVTEPDEQQILIDEVPAGKKLAITTKDVGHILSESEEKIASLRRALGS